MSNIKDFAFAQLLNDGYKEIDIRSALQKTNNNINNAREILKLNTSKIKKNHDKEDALFQEAMELSLKEYKSQYQAPVDDLIVDIPSEIQDKETFEQDQSLNPEIKMDKYSPIGLSISKNKKCNFNKHII